jgi:signal transduction histidine kinase
MPLPVALVDEELTVIDASEAYAELAGTEFAGLVGAPLAVVFPTGAAAEAARAAVAGGSRFEGTAIAEPSGFVVRVRIAAFDDEARRALALVSSEEGRGEDADRLHEVYAAIRAIKHEINNPLTGALGNINLLLRRADLDDKTRRRLATAEQEIKKVSQLVLRLSELAPQQAKSTPS